MKFFEETFNLPKLEEKILNFWEKNNIFKKSVLIRQKQKSPKFIFYEGPPTANGKPGIHHVLARSFKDIILRYKTMRGYLVPRKAGWDTHGLPVELEIEKELGFKNKNDILKFGVDKFNQKCKESVWKYKKEWEKLTWRMGFWLDFKNAYITYETGYIESLWSIIKKFWEKKLLYKDYKVVPWCARCGTSLSSHELGQPDSYKTVTDNSVYIKFKILSNKDDFKNSYILSWTTTPWTLPGNIALAINPKHKFIKILNPLNNNEFLILEENSFKRLSQDKNFESEFKQLKIYQTFKANELINLEYEPLFNVSFLKNEKSYKVYPAEFVTTEEGTGIVHTAVMYGEDDYNLGKKLGLLMKHTVLEDSRFVPDLEEIGNEYIILNKEKNLEVENKIFNYLEKKGFLYKVVPYEHEYPHCWRCKSPIIYYARDSWFVSVNKVRKDLIKNNQKINWIPNHIKNGRFGEWLKEEKDWNFSRERFWGTPLPVWVCNNCNNQKVIGSIFELNSKLESSNNEYFLMRHGESQTQIKHIIDSGSGNYKLTTLGKDFVKNQAKKLIKEKIDLIFASPVLRTKQTAEIVSEILNKEVIFDERLKEINLGELSGKNVKIYHDTFRTYESRFENAPYGGESLRDLRSRIWNFISEIENKYQNKKILIISHEYPLWMMMQVLLGWDERKAILEKEKREPDFIKTGEIIKKVRFFNGPRNYLGEFDLHKPYIDEIKFKCEKCGGEMQRVKEVVDVWFDSGAMPIAQNSILFDNIIIKNKLPKNIDYPADYISEAIDQTRGWFYTLLATSTLLGLEPSYKNVICLGLILDKYGKKMSKSIGNVVNPWEMIEKYGIDAVRWYLYSTTPPGEPKNFNPDEILQKLREFHLIIYNSFVFLKTYSPKGLSLKFKPKLNLLDKWLLSRLNQTIINVTNNLDKYEIREACLELEKIIDDLSRWYIRRSRKRFQKPQNIDELKTASYILGFTLNVLSKLIAPMSPFFAEALYNETKLFDKTPFESVHLSDWPKEDKKIINKKLMKEMELIRDLAKEALKERALSKIKVRQPLLKLSINLLKLSQAKSLKNNKELIQILKEEINVKEIIFDNKIKNSIELDKHITSELYEEGILRELIRLIQDLRNRLNLKPQNKVKLFISSDNELLNILKRNEKIFKNEVNAKEINFKKVNKFNIELNTQIDNKNIWIGLIN
jgi:isoleucyl-tRNA synthetase